MRSRSIQTAYIIISLLVVTMMGFLFKFYIGFAQEWFNNYIAAVFYEIFWCLLAFLFWRSSDAIAQIPLWVFIITCGLEFLQLWHPPLLTEIRSTFLGRTLLGSTFSLWDFPHYVLGCFLGRWWLQQLEARDKQKAEDSF